MQRKITVEEVEQTINQYEKINEPIIIKREDKDDLIIISMEEYRKNVFLSELGKKIEEGEQDVKNGNTFDARKVLEELKEKYDV